MAWNESGGGDKDPWGNRGNNNDGPPDLDEAIRAAGQAAAGSVFFAATTAEHT